MIFLRLMTQFHNKNEKDADINYPPSQIVDLISKQLTYLWYFISVLMDDGIFELCLNMLNRFLNYNINELLDSSTVAQLLYKATPSAMKI